MLLLFLTSSVLVANPKILLYTVLLGTVEARSVNVKKTTTTTPTVANPARGLLTRGVWHSGGGDWKATVLKAEVWVETAMEGGRRFVAA